MLLPTQEALAVDDAEALAGHHSGDLSDLGSAGEEDLEDYINQLVRAYVRVHAYAHGCMCMPACVWTVFKSKPIHTVFSP